MPAGFGEASDAVVAVGEGSAADFYTGIEVNALEKTIIVSRIPDDAADAEFRRAAEGFTLILRDTTRNMRELISVQERIGEERDRWRAQGINIFSVSVETTGVVLVGVEEPSKAAPLKEAYGDVIEITKGAERFPLG